METNLAQAQYVAESHEVSPKSSVLERIARYAMYVCIALVPVWFSTFTFDVIEFNKQVLLFAGVLISGVLYLIDTVRSGKFYIRSNAFYFPLLAVWLAIAIASVFSKVAHVSIFGLGEARLWSLLTISLLLLAYFLFNALRLKNTRYVLSLSILVAMLFGLLQLLGIFVLNFKFALLSNRAFNTFGSLNNLGFISAIMLPFFWGEAVSFNNKLVNSVVRWGGSAIAFVLLVLINWWVLWLVAFVGLFFLIVCNLIVDRSIKTKHLILPLSVIVIGVLLAWVHFSITSIHEKLPVEVLPNQKASYAIDWAVLRKSPVGYGPSNFPIVFDQFKPREIAASLFYNLRFDNAVSGFTTVIAETGLLGLSAILYLIVSIISAMLRTKSRELADHRSLVSRYASLVGLGIGFFLYPFTIVPVFLLLILLFSVSQSSSYKLINLDSSNAYSFIGSLVFIVCLVGTLIVGYTETNMVISNVYLARSAHATSSDSAMQYFVKSINSDIKGDRGYRLASSYLLQMLATAIQKGPIKGEAKDAYNEKVQNYLSSTVDLSVKSTDLNPADAQNWMNRGYIYQNIIGLVGGADASAIAMYKESLARNPNDPVAYFRMGNVYLSLSESAQSFLAQSKDSKTDARAIQQQIVTNLDLAQKNFEQAIALNNGFGQALYNLAVVYEHKGQLKESIAQFQKLYKQAPNDPSLLFQLGLLYYRNNQKDNALAAWERAVQLFPDYANARWYLSLVYEERGDLDRALAQVIAIQKSNPDNDLVEQRLKQLQEGRRLIPPEKVLDQKPL